MRIRWKHLGAGAVAMAAGGMLIAWLGLIDVRASSGHWRITDWFLHFVMRSSIRTAAIGIEVPDLDNPAYLPLAAGHYEAACADCHGSPERAQSAVALAMLPPPPALEDVVGYSTVRDRQARSAIYRHAGLACSQQGRRALGDDRFPSPLSDAEC